jgi:tRNA (mo5U34)-methyltransferase
MQEITMVTRSREEIDRLIQSVKWFHSFEVLPGIRTPGFMWHDAGRMLDELKVPKDLSGADCLDIGSWDGPTAFELETRGGRVVALDIQDPSRTAFNVAKMLRGSSVEYVMASVYDLHEVFGERRFDFVAFFGVYYHLKCPIIAFEQIAKVMKQDATLVISGEVLRNYAENLDGQRAMNFDARGLADIDVPLTLVYPGKYKNASNWHVPNLACVKSWLKAAGLELKQHYFIDNSESLPLPTQALRARAKKIGSNIEEHPLVGVTMWKKN